MTDKNAKHLNLFGTFFGNKESIQGVFMKMVIVFVSLFTSVVASAGAPGPLQTFLTVLADSGLRDATNIVEKEVGEIGEGFNRTTLHTLEFTRRGERYICNWGTFNSHEIHPGEYVVSAHLGDCKDQQGNLIKLNNDYTNDGGTSVFTRVFFNNNSAFRLLTEDEDNWLRRAERANVAAPPPIRILK